MATQKKPQPPQKSSGTKISSKQVVPVTVVASPAVTTEKEAVEAPPSPSTLPQEPALDCSDAVSVLPAESTANSSGQVTLIYEQYNELFSIHNGSITSDTIDEVYCLSFVMEGCWIHLSKYNPTAKRTMEIEADQQQVANQLYLVEAGSQPKVVFHGLVDGETYYVYVEQDHNTLLREQEELKQQQIDKTVG